LTRRRDRRRINSERFRGVIAVRDRFAGGAIVPTRGSLVDLHAGHVHTQFRRLSRRGFLQGAAGAAIVGAAAGSGLLGPAGVEAAGPGRGVPLPIPATLDFFGVPSHVQAPPFTGADSDPATVFNFEGSSGIAFVSGEVERHDRHTRQSRVLPYVFNDMRFMKGIFRGRDGHTREATFAFV
jgi:hypothetical protein